MNPRKLADPDAAFLRTLTLLYVEDDELTQATLGQILRRRVGRLLTASDGLAGLTTYCAELPDLVLTDIQMPLMDGLAMSEQIRRLSKTVPILVTTAFEQADYFISSIELGIDKYLAKPVEVRHLDAALLACAHRLRADKQLASRGALTAELRHHQAVSLMAGGLAHDYNNLLQVILGNVGLARELAEPGSLQQELLRAAESSAQQAGQLGQQLQLIATGGIVASIPVLVAELLTQTISEVLEGSAVTHRLVLEPDVPQAVAVRGDPRRLAVLFAQLTTNALEAMPDGGTLETRLGLLTLPGGTELPLEEGEYLHIAMCDTGRGIAPEIIGRIFDPYFTTKPRGTTRGTGLGLAICRSVMDQHRGLLTAASGPGLGATFHAYLPLDRSAEATPP
jgi:signal transduction histidine kinase